MRKKWIMVFALILALSLAACTTNGTTEPPAPQPEAPAPAPEPEPEPPAAQPETPAAGGDEQIMSTGPHGETATSAKTLALTAEEKDKIKAGGHTAAICFHYSGNDWSKAQLMGLTDTFKDLGIEIIATTDANFKPEQQVADIETVMALNPDILISIPTDATATEAAYMKASEAGITIVFMDNCPPNMKAGKDYVSVVSADNYGNGVVSARIMGEKLGGKGEIAMVYFEADFFVTNQRDSAFENTIKTEFPDIKIVEKSGFNDINKVDVNGDAVLTKYPNINGMYATWDVPAEGVTSAALAAGRNDLVITTIDLGDNVAKIIAEDGVVKGLGAQRPYDQGVAEALLAAYGLLGKAAPEYVAVPALRVDRSNVDKAYEEVYHVPAPAFITDALR